MKKITGGHDRIERSEFVRLEDEHLVDSYLPGEFWIHEATLVRLCDKRVRIFEWMRREH